MSGILIQIQLVCCLVVIQFQDLILSCQSETLGFGSKNLKTCLLVMTFLMSSNAFCCSSVHSNFTSFRVSLRIGSSIDERFGKNLIKYFAIPISHRTPLMSSSGGISTIALNFDLSAFRPPRVSVFPIYGTSLHPNLILSLFSLIDFSTWSCMAASSVSPFPTTSMSSAMIWTPFKPCSASFRAD